MLLRGDINGRWMLVSYWMRSLGSTPPCWSLAGTVRVMHLLIRIYSLIYLIIFSSFFIGLFFWKNVSIVIISIQLKSISFVKV